jgi:peptide/nickel transport system substrate-binding protein
MQSMDWQTLVGRRAKKDPPSAGGWNAFMTSWVTADVMNPVSAAYVNSACEKASFGWPCDEKMEKLRDDFAHETEPAKQKAIAEAVQMRNIEMTQLIPLGEFLQPVALRKSVTGFLAAPAPVFWNLEKK